jgi:hypothetical protein
MNEITIKDDTGVACLAQGAYYMRVIEDIVSASVGSYSDCLLGHRCRPVVICECCSSALDLFN